MNESMLLFNFSEMYSLRSSWLQYFPVESVRTTVSFLTVSAFHVIVWPQQFPVSWFPYPFLPLITSAHGTAAVLPKLYPQLGPLKFTIQSIKMLNGSRTSLPLHPKVNHLGPVRETWLLCH